MAFLQSSAGVSKPVCSVLGRLRFVHRHWDTEGKGKTLKSHPRKPASLSLGTSDPKGTVLTLQAASGMSSRDQKVVQLWFQLLPGGQEQ